MVFLSLFNNLTLIIAMSVFYSLILHRWGSNTVFRSILSGILFGTAAVVAMMNSLVLMPGVIFDGRSIIVSVAGFIGGPWTAFLAGLISASYRIWLGGAGTMTGICVIASSALIGFAYHELRRRGRLTAHPFNLWLFGFLVHAAMLFWMLTLPKHHSLEVIRQIYIPILTIYPLGTYLIASLLLAQESRHAAQHALCESEERYRLLFENAPIGIGLFARDGRMLTANDIMHQIAGYWRVDFNHFNLKDLFRNPDEYNAVIERIGRIVSFQDEEVESRRSNGKPFYCILRIAPLEWNQETVWFVLVADITERKQAEIALRNSEILYHSLVETLPQSIFRKDTQGRFTFANTSFCLMLGKDMAEVIGKTDLDFYPPELANQYRDDDRRVMETGQNLETVEENRTLQGGGTIVQVTKTPVKNSDGCIIGVQGIFRDITERRMLEKQLRQAQKMEAIGILAGGIAHDFNNLLTIITGYTFLVMSKLKLSHADLHGQLQESINAANRASDLIRQLLIFSRRDTMRCEYINLNQIIENVVKMLRRVIGEQIDLQIQLADGLPYVYADSGHIEQILMNLCVNARDAMPNGGEICIRTESVDLDASLLRNHSNIKEGNYVSLTVSDTGIGMPPEVLEHVFEPFFTTKEVGKGTGLGLATVYGIVKQHGGSIDMYSELGQGTRIHIFFPAKPEKPASESKTAPPCIIHGGQETIFLAEDEEIVRKLTQRVLQNAGYRVLVAKDGEEAIRLFEEMADSVNLVILDAVMPKQSGKEVVEYIRAIKPSLPIVFCSGYNYPCVDMDSNAGEKIDYLSKPYNPSDLLQKIRNILDHRNFQQDIRSDDSQCPRSGEERIHSRPIVHSRPKKITR